MKNIKTVNDVLDVIKKLPSNFNIQNNLKSLRYFRGQSNFEWNLVPGVYRDNLFYSEKIFINEAMHKYPLEFKLNDKFSNLVKMQHYGLKTGMLDLTENPLIALYFSCVGDSNKDGALYIFNNAITIYSNDSLVETLMDYIYKFSDYKNEENELLNHFMNKQYDDYSRRSIETIDDLIDDLTLQGVFVQPKMVNIRLVSQQGAFLIFGMKLKEVTVSKNPGNYGKRYYTFEPNIISESDNSKIGAQIYKIKIQKEYKKDIIKELDLLNINSATVFKELEYQMKYINQNIIDNSFNIS